MNGTIERDPFDVAVDLERIAFAWLDHAQAYSGRRKEWRTVRAAALFVEAHTKLDEAITGEYNKARGIKAAFAS